jgi:hypothetical protein
MADLEAATGSLDSSGVLGVRGARLLGCSGGLRPRMLDGRSCCWESEEERLEEVLLAMLALLLVVLEEPDSGRWPQPCWWLLHESFQLED